MRMFCLHEGFHGNIRSRLEYIERACRIEGIVFCALDSLSLDFSKLPVPEPGDLLFNCARGSETLESLLLSSRVTTFYLAQPTHISTPVDTVDWAIVHERAGLSVPETIFSMTTDRQMLTSYVEYLGGFPLVIKVRNGTRGVGTIKIESWPNLLSVVDYLVYTDARFIMRRFILNKGTARLVVLGDEVIASEFRDNLPNDFRVSGDGTVINYYSRNFDQKSADLAVAATRLANVANAGVDIIFDENDKPYLLEVNAPHNFVPPQQVTGVDISGLMVRWLRDKSKRAFRT